MKTDLQKFTEIATLIHEAAGDAAPFTYPAFEVLVSALEDAAAARTPTGDGP